LKSEKYATILLWGALKVDSSWKFLFFYQFLILVFADIGGELQVCIWFSLSRSFDRVRCGWKIHPPPSAIFISPVPFASRISSKIRYPRQTKSNLQARTGLDTIRDFKHCLQSVSQIIFCQGFGYFYIKILKITKNILI
jgi:hypothetical protein